MAKDANKERALMALMDADSFTSAAAAAGLSRKTLYNYLHGDLDFVNAYQNQRKQMAIERAERLAGERQNVLDTITSIMNDEAQPGAVRLKAAAHMLREVDEAQSAADKVLDSMDFDLKHPEWQLM